MTTVESNVVDVPQWHLAGDWFDVCNCNIPCPCTFAQPPSSGDCQGVLAWHIREGHYGDVPLDGLNIMALAAATTKSVGRVAVRDEPKPGWTSLPQFEELCASPEIMYLAQDYLPQTRRDWQSWHVPRNRSFCSLH